MGNERILVVEDHRDARELLVDWLASEGYRVAEATNGAEALALLHSGLKPELVLLDLMMPIMDGWSFMKAAISERLLGRSQVWVVSAVDHMDPPAGVCGALSKPVDLERVLDVVRHAVGLQQQPPAA